MNQAAAPTDLPDVLFVTRKWAPAMGGMETYCAELTTELARHARIQIIALPGRAGGAPPRLPSLLGFPFTVLRGYLARERPPGIIHVGDLASWPLALAGLLRAGRPAIVISAHGSDAGFHRRPTLAGRAYGAYLRIGARLLRGARVIANSAATAQAAAETGWTVSAIVPLATRSPALGPPPSPTRNLLFAGRLIEQKGCRWFAENVLPHLPADIRLTVAGRVWDESERAALSHPRVDFVGVLAPSALAEAYCSALCVVVPNLAMSNGAFEGFGLVAAEAAAAGGVVIAADTGGLKEAVINGETGFHVPPGDAGAWIARIVAVADWSADERASFTDKAMTRARAHYAWPRVASEVAAVYSSVMPQNVVAAKQAIA